MRDPQNPFADMLAMGQQWAKAMNQDMGDGPFKGFEALWPTMPKDMMEAFMGKGANPEGLDAKTKLLLTLHGLTIQGGLAEPQIRLTARHAIEAGATEQELAETVAMAAMFGGVPAMTRTMGLVREVLDAGKETQT